MAGQSDREREIFNSALERATLAERVAFLDGACGEDVEMRSRLAALLGAHDSAGGGFLPMDSPTRQPDVVTRNQDVSAGALISGEEQPGDRIGPYKLREKVGEGGCGVVYVAEQEKPVRRRVALKVIKLGMDTRSVIARFEAERQALAMMDHPNIAKVLDAGATAAGRPYFVMELVRGTKITDYCDRNKLTTRARLDLFIKVCQAIQHAHQKGIIHRDIKPSNILVTLHDGVPVPKIIDFGIAKATEGRLTDLTVYTDLHQFIGTPAYVSPEQAELSGLDIDTRADIYSLGVLLYELLTGRTPFDAKALLKSGLDELRKTIRETEPLPPSTRLSTMLSADLTEVAQRHSAEPPRLISIVRGDLDWIVLKALEKDRARRYETANGLAMDIQRHLNNEPIVARPQSSAYRFQKLVIRNKLLFTAVGGVAAAIVFGLVGIVWQWRQAEHNHQEAEANLYAADMNRAAQVLDDLGPAAARGLLERHVSQGRLHGFEWRYLWKKCLGDFAYSFPSHSNSVWKLSFSPDGKILAALEAAGTLRVLDMRTRTESICLTNVTGLAGFTKDTQELVLLQGEQNQAPLVRYDPKTHRVSATFPMQPHLNWLPNLLQDGFTALLPGRARELSLVNVRNGEVTKEYKLSSRSFPRWQAIGETCAVSGDGKWVFSLDNAEEEGTTGRLSIHDMNSGEILATYLDEAPGTPKTIMTDRFYMLRLLPGGRTAIWATRDGYLHRWQWGEPSLPPLAEHGHHGIIWDIACSPDGKRLATAGDDGTVRVWDAANLSELRILRGHDSAVFTVAFSPDGQWLASADQDGAIKLWDLGSAGGSGQAPVIAARQLANRLLFAPDGQTVAVGTDDDGISVISASSCQVTASFTDLLFPARFASDGIRIVGLGGVGNLVTGKVERLAELPDLAYPWAQDVSPDGRWLIYSFNSKDMRSHRTELRDLERGTVVTNFIPHSMVIALRFAQDGKTILASKADGTLDWWTMSSAGLETRRKIQVGHFSRAMALSPDGGSIALGGDSRISLVDYQTGSVRQPMFGHAQEITGMAFSPDGGTLASCSLDGTIKLWNLQTKQEVCTITFDVKPAPGKEIGVQGVAFAPDGNSLWAFSRSGVLKYWRAATSDEISEAVRGDKP
ncbi:MAG TPA: protein kinase [Candidatus Baltobacteraceae bacterium]|jgi:serine/threonine protein kinase/WD40 repeat protein|nr:protein kinase [Candidatus Baltobacteraceae bacterium]